MVLGILMLTSENAVFRLQGDDDYSHMGRRCPRHYLSVTGWTKCLSSVSIFGNYSSGVSEFPRFRLCLVYGSVT